MLLILEMCIMFSTLMVIRTVVRYFGDAPLHTRIQ